MSEQKYKDAFHAWFYTNYKNDPLAGSEYLFTLAKHGGVQNIVWSLLERTGDSGYTKESFFKAAVLALNEAVDSNEKVT